MSKFLPAYLKFWAKLYLKKRKPQIIAVTGSAGKTSTKEAIFEVLRAAFGQEARRSEGNLNTIYGIPLAILGFKKPPVPLDKPASFWPWIPTAFLVPFKIFFNRKTKYLVLEIAADKPGDIEFTTEYLKPNVAVITNLGPAHLEIFGTIENIIQEKTGLLRALAPNGWAILNYDDENSRKLNFDSLNIKTIAIDEKADVIAKNITTEIINLSAAKPEPITKFQIITTKEKFLAETKTLGRQTNVYPALIAAAIGEIFNIPKEKIVAGLKNIVPEKHRMEVFRGKNGSTIIDDSYNANPLSMRAALGTLKILPAKRKIAILGDMLELGTITEKAHKIIGQYSREIADETIAVGDLAKNYLADPSQHYFTEKQEAINFLLKEVREGDILLVKASRGIGLEVVVEALKAN